MSDHKIKLVFALFFICFIMPVFIFYSGHSYFQYLQFEFKKSNLLMLAGTISGKITAFTDNRKFWCHQMNAIFERSSTKEEMAKNIFGKLKQNKQKADWIIWGPDWKSIKSSNFSKVAGLNLDYTGKTFRKAVTSKGRRINYSEKIFLRKLLGPHIFFANMVKPMRKNEPRLLETNFKHKAGLLWNNYSNHFTAFALFPPSIEQKEQGLTIFIKQFKKQNPKREIFILKDGNVYSSNNKTDKKKLHYLKKRISKSEKNIIGHKNKLFYGEQLPDNSFFFIADDAKANTNSANKPVLLFTLIWAFFNLLFFQSFSMLSATGNLKVKRAIYGFIGLSNILPLIILAIFASQYMNQKYLVMIDNKKIQAIDFLHGIEQEFLNLKKNFPYRAKQVIDKNMSRLNKLPINLHDARILKNDFDKYGLSFNIVASQALTLITREAVVNEGKMKLIKTGQTSNSLTKLVDVTGKLGNCYLAFLNKSKISTNYLTELELLADMVFQKSIEETLHYFVELSDKIAIFGFGTEAIPSFAQLIKGESSGLYNYFCIFQFDTNENATQFLESIKTSRLANHFGLKIIFKSEKYLDTSHIYPFKKQDKLKELFNKLKIYPPAKAGQVVLDEKEWLFTGYKSSIMKSIELAAFYPVTEIQRKLDKEKNDLITLLVANLFIILIIAYFFSKTLFAPIQHLEKGTQAINTRHFSYRLPDMGQDEFGKMADIFNNAISDLEELSVAGVVQQSLFPEGKIATGNFNLHGKSEALTDLGGDYLDYFDIDDENFGVILGDVAGHGVGAALIMAMAKSTTINSVDYYKKPVEFTSRLHQLIYNSKTRKQKKIMTFQYLLVNKRSNSLTFCNAGGCNPFIVNGAQNKVEEIKLPAPALGAFKKAKYKDLQIAFAPGDTMVLYTDGIVEARNKNGEEIGYELFKEILLRNYTTDPEQYYQNVLKEYHSWLGEADAEDDLTMVFLNMKAEA
ncbi:MAG: SpoIIE family protein phosphatase [Candidatus Rifleibacteriota bacterium]